MPLRSPSYLPFIAKKNSPRRASARSLFEHRYNSTINMECVPGSTLKPHSPRHRTSSWKYFTNSTLKPHSPDHKKIFLKIFKIKIFFFNILHDEVVANLCGWRCSSTSSVFGVCLCTRWARPSQPILGFRAWLFRPELGLISHEKLISSELWA